MKITIEVPDSLIPSGYEAYAAGPLQKGDHCISNGKAVRWICDQESMGVHLKVRPVASYRTPSLPEDAGKQVEVRDEDREDWEEVTLIGFNASHKPYVWTVNRERWQETGFALARIKETTEPEKTNED